MCVCAGRGRGRGRGRMKREESRRIWEYECVMVGVGNDECGEKREWVKMVDWGRSRGLNSEELWWELGQRGDWMEKTEGGKEM